METGDTPVVWEGLLTAFLSGALSPAAFHDAFLHGWRQARDGATDPAPAAIEDLFYTVEAFCPDPALRSDAVWEADEEELRAHAARALATLRAGPPARS